MLIAAHTLNAQNTISGKASSYKGDVLSLYSVDDRITFTLKLLDTAKVDEQGNFCFNIKTQKTQRVYIDLPTVKAYFYIEPNHDYSIRIPRKQQLTTEQKLNPGFDKEEIPALVIADKSELNHKIAYFNNFFGSKRMKILVEPNEKNKLKMLDTLKMQIDTFMQYPENQYFSQYKFYNFALLHLAAIQANRKFYLDSFFVNKPVLLDNPAYMTFFNQFFENYLAADNELFCVDTFALGLQNADFQTIKNSVAVNYDTLRNSLLSEIVALKILYDLFYSSEKYQEIIIRILQNILTQNNYDSNVLHIATNFYQKIMKLRADYPTPQFSLPDKKHKIRTLSDFNGDFVYLNFFNPQSYACMQQIEILKKYNDSRIKKLRIVTIFVGDDYAEMQNFLKSHKDYKWTFLFCKNTDEVLRKYDIVTFPTYFLVYPDGRLVDNKTPSPTENFEAFYNIAYKKWQKNRLKFNQ